jgi:hypothetical protein
MKIKNLEKEMEKNLVEILIRGEKVNDLYELFMRKASKKEIKKFKKKIYKKYEKDFEKVFDKTFP